MKKLVFAATIALTVLSCKKENPVPTATLAANTNQEMMNNINAITNSYVSGLKPGNEDEKKINWKKVLGADLKGVVTGAGIGAGVGALGGPGGAVTGAIVGGVVYGAGCSIEAAGAAAIKPGTTFGNSGNPYDNAGILHYTIMSEVLAHPSIVYDASGILDYENYQEYAFSVVSASYTDASEYATSFTPATIQDLAEGLSPDQSIVAYIDALPETEISASEKEILHAYFSGFQVPGTAEQFASYSINIEEQVSTGSLSDQQKERLLIVMSTARHGYGFYNL